MNKVYTLTLTNTENYGALLQAFALKKYISTIGYDCSVIDYFNPLMSQSQATGWRRYRSIIWRKTFAKLFRNKERQDRTLLFKKDYLEQNGHCYSSAEELKCLNSNAYAFIVGSDQVWNPRVNAEDNAYFLDFSDKKKVAYAASFGTNSIPESYLQRNRELLSRFSAISIRESSGVSLLDQIIGIKAELVCDPVFLLDCDEWVQNLQLTPPEEQNYVLCYVMPGDKDVVHKILEVACDLAARSGLKVVVLGEKSYKRGNEKIAYDHSCGPKEFMSKLICAKYVVTNSFHGTAFSIIFKKNFYTVMKREKIGRNTRIDNLLEKVDLKSRVIYSDDALGCIGTDVLDYSQSVTPLNVYIDHSKDFLGSALAE